MKATAHYIDKLTLGLERLTAGVLVALALLILYDALMRYFFSHGSILLQELEWHLFDIIILFSLVVTLKYNQHVRVDIFYHRFSIKRQELIQLLGYLFMVIPFSVLILVVGVDYVAMSYTQMEGSANPGGLPFRYLIKSTMVLGFLFLMLQAVSEIIRYFHKERDQ